jgi:hypothetical protein
MREPKRPYLCLTCGASAGPMTDEQAATLRAEGHDLKLDDSADEQKRAARNARARARRRAIADAYDSLGMKRVRGNLGGTYYE